MKRGSVFLYYLTKIVRRWNLNGCSYPIWAEGLVSGEQINFLMFFPFSFFFINQSWSVRVAKS